jgi:hypothetical protein
MAQFAIPAAILGVAIIGYWLLAPESQTAKPDSMPDLNSSVRGKGVPVNFGTNKLSSQIGWVNNFRAVRQQSGSKFGGSGGFGSMKGGGSTGTQYLYYWDMMFQFGIMDQPSMIRQGWVGSDRIYSTVLSTLTAGQSDIIRALYPTHNKTGVANSALLNYTTAFVAPGYGTGDADLDDWSHLATVGIAARFPYNAWVGFEQLELGQSPAVPQLYFEWVPIPTGGGFDANGSFKSTATAGGEGFATMIDIANGGLIHGQDSKNYWMVGFNNASYIHLICLRNGAHIELTTAQFQADLATKGLTPPAGVYSDYSINTSGSGFNVSCDGTPYFWVIACASAGASGYAYMGIRYKINSLGALEIDGGLTGLAALGGRGFFLTRAAKVSGSSVLVFGTSTHGYDVVSLPLTGDLNLGTNTANWNSLFTDETPSTNFFDFMGANRIEQFTGGIALQSNGAYDILIYIGQAEYDYVVANPAHSTAYSSVTAPGVYKISSGSVTLLTDFVFDDIKKHYDGSASTSYYDDYGCGPTSFLLNNICYVAFSRGYSSQTDNTPDGSFSRVRLFTWNGTAATVSGVLEDSTFDTVADLGFTEGNRYSIIPPNRVLHYIDQSGDLLYISTHNVSSGYRRVFGIFATQHGGLDVTPAYIIYRILTSDVFGFSTSALFGYTVTADRINPTEYANAVQWCVDNGIYVSVSYSNQGDLLSILNELLALYGGYLTDYDGIIHFGIVTGTDDPVRVIDNSHLVADKGQSPVTVTKAAVEDGYNKVIFNYLDRDLDYSQNQVEVSDEVDYDINGPRVLTYDARFTMNGSCATNIANRALWANLYGKDSYAFKLGRKDADLVPGTLITLVDSFDSTLQTGVRARIVKWKESKRLEFDVTAVREYPRLINSSTDFTDTTSTQQGYGTLVQSVLPLRDFRAYELPTEFQGAQAEIYFGYNQASLIMGAQLYLSTGGSYVLTQDVQPYAISGIFPTALESRPQGWCEDNVEFYLFPSSGFSIATPTFVQTYDLDDVSQALRASGAGVLIVGSEAVSVEDLTLVAQNRYRARRIYRGWGGTPITSHSSGAFFHMHQAGIFAHEITPDDVGTTFSYKIVPYNFAGDTYNVASIAAQTYSVVGDYWRPRLQGRSRIYVQSPIAWSSSTELTGPFIGVASGGCDVVLTWPNPSNSDGFGAGAYGGGTYGHFENGATNWRVDVASRNGTKVSSFLVTSTYFQYNLAQNSADFNGFARDLVLKITPYTAKGDGFADVRSLSMNW